MINVWGDAVGAGVVEALSHKQLAKMDHTAKEEEAMGGQINPSFIADHKQVEYDERL